MKRNIILLLLLLCPLLVMAQGENKLFQKYADMDNVTSVYISKKMFQMMPVANTAGLSLMNMKGKVDGLEILTTENPALRAQMKKEFGALISAKHEELMRVKDESTRATFYIRENNDLIRELIMLADTKDEFSVIQLVGRFTLQDIQEITNQQKK